VTFDARGIAVQVQFIKASYSIYAMHAGDGQEEAPCHLARLELLLAWPE
jgi:hypothetical protein